MVARGVKVVDCRCHGRSSFSALQLIDLSRQTVSLKVDTEGPEPIIELDPTAEVLLNRAAQLAGLGYAIRCLAAWEYVTERADRDDSSTDRLDPSRAAAIESVVSKRLGMRVTVPVLAERYECSVESVRRHLKFVQPVVRDCTDLRW
jgi:hypothetical protein